MTAAVIILLVGVFPVAAQKQPAAMVKTELPEYRRLCDSASTLGFERDGAWRTAPVEKLDIVPAEKLRLERAGFGKDWRVEAKTMEELAIGVRTVPEHATEGKKALRWTDHPAWPTIYATDIPHDWSGAKSVSIDIHSSRATGEIVFMALASDSAAVSGRNFRYLPLQINWSGDRRLTLPLDSFLAYGKPAGLDKVDAVYFFTKMFGCQPHPYSELYLDNMQLCKTPAGDEWKQYLAALPQERRPDGFIVRDEQPEWQRDQLNHEYPETAGDKVVTAPYTYQKYFQNERALFKYYPRFIPGYICFDQSGKTYINSGDIIQWRGADGKWQTSNIRNVVVDWAKKQGWSGLDFRWASNMSEKAIRFDQDGDAYAMIMVERLDNQGQSLGWKTRGTLLLHSRDRMKSWTVYQLPARTAEFEKLDGHNQDCLKRPPVILLGDFGYFPEADRNGYVLLPLKNADGTLTLPKPVKYAENNIGPCQHSGGGNQAVTIGDKVYIVFGWTPDQGAYPDLVKKLTGNGEKIWDQWKLSVLKNTVVAKTLPPIPADHPGLKQEFYNKNIKADGFSKDGVPTFIVSYDIPAGTVSKPVFLGCGGGFVDGHNWPAITVDGKGYLHVIINGHHNPVNYTRSIKPLDISAWTPPVYIRDGKDVKPEARPHLSYATLNCDRAGNLYCVHRSTTGYYNNHLALYRMTPEGVWSEEQTLVTPFKFMYSVWGHKMMYDPGSDRLCFTFYGQSSMKQLSRDQYEFDVFYWPEHEKLYNTPANGLNNGPAKPDGTSTMLLSSALEIASLIYDCPSGQWRLTTTKDLK